MNPTEAQEAKTLVAYLRIKGYKHHHIANETGSGRIAMMQGIRNKQQGTSKGFPDYLVIVNNRLIAIELKRVKGSTTSLEQKEWIRIFNECGVPAVVAKGAQAAIIFIEDQASRK